ncbi:MAG TPA: GNAT family N-acetyltransferase, partial [Solirubrobacter sp.]|nr:GNAT family N-acetyltransferase [Solirubrobacter sp.]
MTAPVAADVHIVLRDGSTAHVRPVVPDDAPALRAFLAGLSERSRWLRFFSLGVNLDRAAERAAAGDRPEGYGLIVTTGAEERVVAHAVFEVERPDRAEVAFAVADEMQGRGLATVLLAHLAQVAAARGVSTFTATVLPENKRMVSVFRESGFPVEVHASPDGIELEFPTELGADARRRFEDRDRIAAVAAVERVLRPRSVAVVGASRRPGSFGGAAFRHVLANGFRGELYPVNPNADFVGSRRASASVAAAPGPVDLAIVAVPAETVPDVARDCAAAGVPALVVITAGFSDAGPAGAARLADLLEVCRASGMRLVGPNCMGIVNTHADVRLTATFARADVPAGTIGFVSQSGAFGAAAIDGASRRGIGLSAF